VSDANAPLVVVAPSQVSTGPNYASIIASLVTVGSAVSIAIGNPALGAIISDPHTAAAATAAVAGISGLISAFSGPVHALVTRVSATVHKA
jgi:hypothetical protein